MVQFLQNPASIGRSIGVCVCLCQFISDSRVVAAFALVAARVIVLQEIARRADHVGRFRIGAQWWWRRKNVRALLHFAFCLLGHQFTRSHLSSGARATVIIIITSAVIASIC